MVLKRLLNKIMKESNYNTEETNPKQDLLTDIQKYPYHGICGKCGNYQDKLDKHCLCQTCYQFGVRKIGGMMSDEVFKFVKPRF